MSGTLSIDTLQNGAGESVPVTTVINGSAKAWVNFDGSSGAIRKAFNVSSVTKGGTGNYTVNFSTPLSDINYSVVATGNAATGGGSTGYSLVRANAAQSQSSFGLVCLAGNASYGGATDFVYSNVSVFD